jgi:hypothetical protein
MLLLVAGAGNLFVLRALLLFHLGYSSIVGVVLTSGLSPSSVVVFGYLNAASLYCSRSYRGTLSFIVASLCCSRGTLLSFVSSVGLLPNLSHAPVSTGLSRLLALSLVEAMPL